MVPKPPVLIDQRFLTALSFIQIRLSLRVRLTPLERVPQTVAGCDVAFKEGEAWGAAVLFDLSSLSPLEASLASGPVPLPYVPGFLSFREIPVILKALHGLKIPPDLVLVDGQGIAHPRGLGLASHLGLLLEIPTIGCAKSRLIGQYREPGPERGLSSPLLYKGRKIGLVLRTRKEVKPVFVSPGHLIDLNGAAEVVLKLSRYRLPEPLRLADRLSKEAKGGRWPLLLSGR
ncbi:deoxyribonuclease V [Thermosulfuriphilus sp.]